MAEVSGKRGAFILIEGLDHSGKTTQCELLAEELLIKKVPVKIQKFPNRSTEIGKIIDLYLRGDLELEEHAVHLLFSANRWEMSEKIRNDLKNGITVIVDRYIYSGIAFSAAKGLNIEWCEEADKGLPLPDGVIYLDICEEKASLRHNYGVERMETGTIQKSVRSVFRNMYEKNKNTNCPWYWVDASNSIIEVKLNTWNAAQDIINNLSDDIKEFS
ncbi:thymidylate kinase [Pneumocystis carinii B80]|uniref:Thymidylate kinase n=1 Tax=Pneumocystis carinii (strain B80) TaxID=1408658 RepID=A0A0W4ZN35_PNEC8|nr:thymidylate kinase [Pneumocystis carinii B80]KTW29771.1 thymidylate kinase [Pneumocystis carinii B80]